VGDLQVLFPNFWRDGTHRNEGLVSNDCELAVNTISFPNGTSFRGPQRGPMFGDRKASLRSEDRIQRFGDTLAEESLNRFGQR
jgi:hypothetical protein